MTTLALFEAPMSYTAELQAKLKPVYAPVFRCSLVRESRIEMERKVIRGPQDIAAIGYEMLKDYDREALLCIMFDSKNAVIGVNVVSVGILDSSLVHPRECYKPAIIANAAAIALVHNHPSGNSKPSPEDHKITKRIHEAGELMGIDMLDHVVIGFDPIKSFTSLKQLGTF